MTLSTERLELIERLGVFYTKQGMTPASARIQALLLVSDTVELTFDEIRSILELSKGATSNGINFLLETKKIRYITKTGDRKRYFRSNIELWKEAFTDSFQFLIDMHQLLDEVRKMRTNETVEFNKSLEELTSFMAFSIDELKEVINKWELKTEK